MLRKSTIRPLPWTDKTMSVLRSDLLEACGKDLAGLPSHCLFDEECTEEEAMLLFEFSYQAEEERRRAGRKRGSLTLHSREELRDSVLRNMRSETELLSVAEHELAVKAMIFRGYVPLSDWEDLVPARSLARRLWARVEKAGDQYILHFPMELCTGLLLIMAGDGHKQIRETIGQFNDDLENTLYLLGSVRASVQARRLAALLADQIPEPDPVLLNRFLMAGYDYVYDSAGSLILIHPGVAEPDRMADHAPPEMASDLLADVSDSTMDFESPVYSRMLSLLTDAVRPEIDLEDAVEDLILLVKQNIPWKDLREVFSSMLMCVPTPEMISALKELYDRVPRWNNLSSQVQ